MKRNTSILLQEYLFVCVLCTLPPSDGEIKTQGEGILLNQQSTFKSFWYKHCNYFISSKQNIRQQHISVTISNMLWMSLLKKTDVAEGDIIEIYKKKQKLWQPTVISQ